MFRPLTVAALTVAALGLPMAASAAPKGCPPGLAKKNAACMAPGQAKKHLDTRDSRHREETRHNDHDRHDGDRRQYRAGERISDEYVVVRNPDRYGLAPGTYYRANDYVYRVDPDTRKVLNVIGALAALAD